MKRTILAALLAAGAVVSVQSFADTGLRTIHVTPSTKAINVEYAETVNLDVNGNSQVVKFDSSSPVQNLQSFVPGAPSIPVYITPSDRFAPDSAGG
jgi:hypothetical protein